jgi:linoleoyl-CoA desaturase
MHAFGEELDAIRDRVIGSLGASDTRYIRRVAAAVRWFRGGRGLLFLAAFSPLF